MVYRNNQANDMLPEKLELWGGIECTVNRVGDVYFDQFALSGHATRLDDLDLFAELGLHTLRYPILWEWVAPEHPQEMDWSWADERLGRLKALGIRPVVGLVHHGSGPRYTSLVDPGFAPGLASFARAFAERYPWVDAYTPVNEPLTTARFSGLYGHWYPHGHSGAVFTRALINQIQATQLAMQAVREVNPAAQLITTEDLGKIHSTPYMAYQADHENERRWLSMDLLTTGIDRYHPLYDYLLKTGIEKAELEQMLENLVAPDMLGMNYYVTSERFLDERLENYPEYLWGGNGRDRYVDVEAVRVCLDGPTGSAALLQEAWQRYQIPLAMTEVHLGGYREDQLRWLVEAWSTANELRQDGMDLRALTVWSLLGSFDWDSLVTRQNHSYETGVFDISTGQPRPTILAQAVRALSQGLPFNHPILDSPGWWQRPERILYPGVVCKPAVQPEALPLIAIPTGSSLAWSRSIRKE